LSLHCHSRRPVRILLIERYGQYEVVTITGVVFSIGFWLAGEDGLAVLPWDYAPNLFTVIAHNTVRSAHRSR